MVNPSAAWLLAASVVACVAGCLPEPTSVPAGSRDLTRQAPGPVDPRPVIAALTRPPEPLSEQQQTLLDAIADNPERFFDSRPPHAVLNEAELVFFAAGRSLELPTWYQQAIERQGPDSPLQVRLALLLQRLGMYDAAEREARRAVEQRPDDPDAHYVLGNLLAQGDDASEPRLREVQAAWRRTLELAPTYAPLDGSPLDQLRDRMGQVDARLAPTP